MKPRRGLGVVVTCAATLIACERAPLCPETHFTTDISVPATQATVTTPVERFGAEVPLGPNGVGVSITDNKGTITFEGRGPIPAFIYSGPSPFGSEMLYAGLGIEDGAWFPFWLYCTPDGRLDKFYGEMTDRDLGVLVPVDGTCAQSGEMESLVLDVPAHTLRQVALTCGFSAQAATPTPLDLGSSRAGSMDFQGENSVLLPFHTLDCRTGCGDLSWFEIHTIAWDPESSTVGFTIIYLLSSGVGAGNGLVETLGTPLAVGFPNAVWTVDR